MEIVKDYPPNFQKIETLFEVSDRTVYAYGDKLYNPNDNYIEPALMKHEEVHARQQGDDPEAWWDRYMVDSNFRLSQEVEAYQAQYKEAAKTIKDKNKLFKYLHFLAQELSSPLYGNIISYQEALKAIKHPLPIRFNTYG